MSAVRARVRDPKTGRFMASAANISAESASPTVLHESFSPSVFNYPPDRRPPLSSLFEEETPNIFPPAERAMAGNNNEWALKMFASRNKGLIRKGAFHGQISYQGNLGVGGCREPCVGNLKLL
jgi:hypothetical protein